MRNAYLSLIGASTLEDFTKTWSVKHEDAGFFSRLLLVAGDADRRIPRPVDPDQAQLDALVQEVQSLVSSVIRQPSVLKMAMTKRQLQRRTNANRMGIEAFTRALANMERDGEVEKSRRRHLHGVLFTRVPPTVTPTGSTSTWIAKLEGVPRAEAAPESSQKCLQSRSHGMWRSRQTQVFH